MILRLKEVLRNKKVTITSLADTVGITQPNMSNIVNSKTLPSLSTLQKIADALEVSVVELFDEPKGDTFQCPKCGTTLTVKER